MVSLGVSSSQTVRSVITMDRGGFNALVHEAIDPRGEAQRDAENLLGLLERRNYSMQTTLFSAQGGGSSDPIDVNVLKKGYDSFTGGAVEYLADLFGKAYSVKRDEILSRFANHIDTAMGVKINEDDLERNFGLIEAFRIFLKAQEGKTRSTIASQILNKYVVEKYGIFLNPAYTLSLLGFRVFEKMASGFDYFNNMTASENDLPFGHDVFEDAICSILFLAISPEIVDKHVKPQIENLGEEVFLKQIAQRQSDGIGEFWKEVESLSAPLPSSVVDAIYQREETLRK